MGKVHSFKDDTTSKNRFAARFGPPGERRSLPGVPTRFSYVVGKQVAIYKNGELISGKNYNPEGNLVIWLNLILNVIHILRPII